jgi:hypothetical protein
MEPSYKNHIVSHLWELCCCIRERAAILTKLRSLDLLTNLEIERLVQ